MSSAEGTSRARGLHAHLPRLVAIAAVVLLVGLLTYGLAKKAPNDSVDQSLANGTAPLAPSFNDPVLEAGRLPQPLARGVKPALADRQLSLGELKGTPFVLNFWASWCIPCREEAPILRQGWARFGPKGILFIGLNMQDLTSDARHFIQEFDVSYPTIREPSNDTAQAYGVTGVPETFFVTAKGRIVGHVIGAITPAKLRQGALAAKTHRLVGSVSGGARRPVR